MNIAVEALFDEYTYTLTYIIYDKKTGDALVIDPVLNYDPNSGELSLKSVQKILNFVKSNKLKVHYILETHAHADHITGAMKLKDTLTETKVAIGKGIIEVQKVFNKVFNFKNFNTSGEQFDILLADSQELQAGCITIKAIHTPGHTPACTSFLIDGMLFVGDSIFMPDSGTGRCDFPAGSSTELYNSVVHKLYNYPDDTKVYVGHDYQPNGRKLAFETTIGESKENNTMLNAGRSESEFIKARDERDATLVVPRLLLPSIQVNINAGIFPEAEDNGTVYLKMPVKLII